MAGPDTTNAPTRSNLPPDQEAVAQQITDLDAELAALRARFDQYFLGIEKRNPSKDLEDLKKRIVKLKTQFIRNTGLKFRVQSLYAKFQSYERLWLKSLKEMEEGTYRRDIFRLRRKNQRAAQSTKPKPLAAEDEKPKPDSYSLEDLEADLPDVLFEDEPAPPRMPPASAPKAEATPPPPKPAEAAAPSPAPKTPPGPPPMPAAAARTQTGSMPAVAPRTQTGSMPAVAPRTQTGSMPAVALRTQTGSMPAVAPRTQTGSMPAVAPRTQTGSMPAVAPRTQTGSMPAVGAGRAAPGAPAAAARPPPMPRTATGSIPIAVAPSAPAHRQPPPPPAPDLPLSKEKIDQLCSAYITAKKRCKESTDGITPEAVAQSLRKQVPQIMKEQGVKSVDFKVVIKDGKAVLKAVPK